MKKWCGIILLFLYQGCVPYQQQLADSEQKEFFGYIGPLVRDAEKFYRVTANRVIDTNTAPAELYPNNGAKTYRSRLEGHDVIIRNCDCYSNPKIIQDKLIVTHHYGGGSTRESTLLLWTGNYYKNLKGEFIVDVVFHSDDQSKNILKILTTEQKVHTLEALQLDNVNFIWIHLVGYENLIPYSY